MIAVEITIKSENGLQASTASKFVMQAMQYQSILTLEANGRKSNGKSLIGIMALGTAKGDVMLMTAEGPDEQEMIDALVTLNESYYGEL